MNIHKFNALECTQNNKRFYISVISNNILRSICYVSSREENPTEGFQRSLNKARAKDIAEYMDKRNGIIPSALILSAQNNAQFTFDAKKSEITFSEKKNSFMVLDGQHRLYGLILSENEYDIPVVIFNNLTTSDEVNLFIDINTTQKGVPTTLLLDIKNLSGRETKKEEKQRRLFDDLNTESVLAGLLSPSKSRVGKITRVSFNQATSDIFDSGFFKDKDIETVYKGVKNYLAAVETNLVRSKSEKAKLTNSVIFRASFSIFQEVINQCFKEYGNLKEESLTNCLEPISRINYDTYTGTSNATYNLIVADMKDELHKKNREEYNDLDNNDLF
ncbi:MULTISPECIES: DGQHR domain-containing protein [Neisseriaceae]|jgi:DGQHR domain protein|uniref:DGQHR domain-containing protein n=2 Tax=Neisseria macacae ATCC 33926 TaxID=997348 RepID=A0ABY3YA08_9NEIS|nr:MULTISPECIES: DGQHR domain-containing protein [Neisseriaceae]UNV86141.1 DGQHR domain-containing protein [Neisseria macacae ATCC 33926]